jgi:hypothetical protein
VYRSASFPWISWKLPIGAPNCFTLAHVRQHQIQARLHDAERAAGEHDPLVVKAAHQHLHAASRLVQDVLERHTAIVEEELAGVRAAHAELVELLRGAEAGEALLDDERRNARRAGLRVGLRIDDDDIRRGPVRDPHLAAVKKVVIAAQRCAQAHGDDVRPRGRFAHGERADVLAAQELRQVAALLLRGAPAAQLVHAQVRVRAVGEAHRCAGAADLLHCDDVLEVAQAAAAVFGSTVMPRRPSAPSSGHRSRGKTFEASISAARGAMSSVENSRTVLRNRSTLSPS